MDGIRNGQRTRTLILAWVTQFGGTEWVGSQGGGESTFSYPHYARIVSATGEWKIAACTTTERTTAWLFLGAYPRMTPLRSSQLRLGRIVSKAIRRSGAATVRQADGEMDI